MSEQDLSREIYTAAFRGYPDRLVTKAEVLYGGSKMEVDALWDTGSSYTYISRRLASQMGMISVGQSGYITPTGASISEQYVIEIILPDGTHVTDVHAGGSDIDAMGIDLILGLQIILLGDFAIRHRDGQTFMSFLCPPNDATDNTKQ